MHKNMHYKKIIIDIFAVTFREEGVDWNSRAWQYLLPAAVKLLLLTA